jgi:hypothetical protein
MPRIYAVQHCHRMRGWEDLVYFHQWAMAVRSAELAARDQLGLVTRVIRKPHGFQPAVKQPQPEPWPVKYMGEFAEPKVEPIENVTDEAWQAEKLRRKQEKKVTRAAGAKARIPTWYDRLNDQE